MASVVKVHNGIMVLLFYCSVNTTRIQTSESKLACGNKYGIYTDDSSYSNKIERLS